MPRGVFWQIPFILAVTWLSAPAAAGPREDVLAVVDAFYDALNSGDAKKAGELVRADGFSEFPSRGAGRLLERRMPEGFVDLMKGGLRADFKILHPELHLYDGSAIFTGYRYGSYFVTAPGRAETVRVTMVIIRTGSRWHIAHIHNSQLIPQ